MNHLEKIIQRTEQRVATLKSTFSRENLQSNGKEYKKRKFVETLHKSSEEQRNSVVAEIKKPHQVRVLLEKISIPSGLLSNMRRVELPVSAY